MQILSVSIHHGISSSELDIDTLGKQVRRSKDKTLYKHVYSGDLVFNMMRAWQGAIGVVKREGMVSPAYISAIPDKQVHPLFMDYCLRRKKMLTQIDNLSYGVTDFRKRLYWNSFVNIWCHIPAIREQVKIASFLKQLDDIITLHQRKLEGLKELKRGYLQKMFPQPGESVPQVRFPGFTGAWKKRKLGDVFTERSERSAKGELLSVTINSGIVKASSLERKDNSSENKSNYKRVEIGDIAYNSMRMWQGASGVSDYFGILSPAYTVMMPNNEVNTLFFSYMFKLTQMIQVFQSSSQGLTSDTWNLKFPLLKNISATVPSYEEQTVIGKYFRNLDERISIQEKRLNQLKRLKIAYLQKMFV